MNYLCNSFFIGLKSRSLKIKNHILSLLTLMTSVIFCMIKVKMFLLFIVLFSFFFKLLLGE
jgi:hypothetical protein